MHNFKAFAIRKEGVINISMIGMLNNSCYSAKVSDKYPGGQKHYFIDPGTAQVFIQEEFKTDSPFCMMTLFPWAGHVNIIDGTYSEVSFFINDSLIVKVPITEYAEEHEEFSVLIPTSSTPEKCKKEECFIFPHGAPILPIYRIGIGPSTKITCEEWISRK